MYIKQIFTTYARDNSCEVCSIYVLYLENVYPLSLKRSFKLRVRLWPCKTSKPYNNFILLIVPKQYLCCGSYCFVSWC